MSQPCGRINNRAAVEFLCECIENPLADEWLPTTYHDLNEFIRLAKDRLDNHEQLGMPWVIAVRYKRAIEVAIGMLQDMAAQHG